jgi:putative sterol carrier protein
MVKDRIMAQLKEIAKRFEDPKIQKRFAGYNKTLMFTFPDIGASMYIKIGDGKVLSIGEGTVNAELQVTMDSSVFLGIMAKTESPMAAYSSGKLKTKGEVPDLLKLQKLLM